MASKKTSKTSANAVPKVLKEDRTASASETATGAALSQRAANDKVAASAVAALGQSPPRIRFSSRDGLTVIEPSPEAPPIDPNRVRQMVEEGLF